MSFDIFHERIDTQKAKEIVAGARAKGFNDSWNLYAGRHYEAGRYWVGPHADDHPRAGKRLTRELEKLFVCRNVIREIVARHINALEPHWKITVKRPLAQGESPTDQEQELIDFAEAIIQEWLDERLTPMDDEDDEDDPITAMLVNVLLNGRATLRLFVPQEGLEIADDGTPFVRTTSLEEAAKLIYLHAPTPFEARLWRYKRSQQQIGLYVNEDEDDYNLAGEGNEEYAELTYLDDAGMTVLRVTSDRGILDDETRMDLGRRLTMHEMRRPVFVTPQLRSMQMALNMCLTMMSRNVVLGGFLERVLLNGQLPGRTVKDADGTERWVPDPVEVGAGSLVSITGIEYEVERKQDATGSSTRRAVTDPSIVYREPVDVTTFEKTKDILYKSMLEEAHQLHYLLADRAESSGEARKEALADFVIDLARTIKGLNRLYRWLIETVLAMATHFAGQPGLFEELRVEAATVVDTGRLSADDMRTIAELIDRGVISEETGLAWLGIQDTQAEQERIAAERDAAVSEQPQAPASAGVDEIERLIEQASLNRSGTSRNGQGAGSTEAGEATNNRRRQPEQ